jgi:hypothetical protein
MKTTSAPREKKVIDNPSTKAALLPLYPGGPYHYEWCHFVTEGGKAAKGEPHKAIRCNCRKAIKQE